MDHNLPLLAVHHLDGGWLWLNASANACPGYIPEERILKEGDLQKGVHDELQMGAISGLSDLQAEEVPSTHINAFADFSKEHRQLALDALLRSDDRCRAILNALAENRRPAALRQHAKVIALRKHESESVRVLAEQILIQR